MSAKRAGWVILGLLGGTLAVAFAEELTFTTYYPAPPAGASSLRADDLAVGRTYRSQTPPPDGAIIEGPVGIGTTSPGAKLHVAGNIRIPNNSQLIGRAVSDTFDINIIQLDSVNAINVGDAGTNFINLGVGGTANAIRIANGGNVGLGTTGPLGKLHVVGRNDTADLVLFLPGADTAAAGTPSLQVGIGTTTPTPGVGLEVANGPIRIRTSRPQMAYERTGTAPFVPYVWQTGLQGSDDAFYVWHDQAWGNALRIDRGYGEGFRQIVNGREQASPTPRIHITASGLLVNGVIRESIAGGTLWGGAPGGPRGRGNFGGKEFVITVADGLGGATDEIWIGPNTAGYQGHVQLVAENIHFNNNSAGGFVLITGGRVGIGTVPNPNAKLDVNGAIYQRGGVLHADYVFTPGYRLESIEEHAAAMWAHRRLPALPPGQRDAAGQQVVELGAQSRGTLEELEKAHLYIAQLHERLAALEARLRRLEAD